MKFALDYKILLHSSDGISMQEKLEDSCLGLCWEDTDEQINLAALSSQTEPILFYDEVTQTNKQVIKMKVLRGKYRGLFLLVGNHCCPTQCRWFCMKMSWLTMEFLC